MSKMSRTKGRTAEREVERLFQDAGFHCDRNIGGRHQVSGDIQVTASPDLAVEVRRRESLRVEAWLAEHRESTPSHLLPVLITRTSRNPWTVCLALSDFLTLLNDTSRRNPE